MVLVETSFPRGGTIQPAPAAAENITFGARQDKKKHDKIKTNKKSVEDDKTVTTNIEAISAELLNYKTIQEGMIVMGTVKNIDTICLKISLPGRMIGKVLASSISESYNRILKEFVASTDTVKDFKSLYELYEIGQIVYVKVLEIKENTTSGKFDINLSLKPSDVHNLLHHENIKKGMLFNGAIEEVQEHGYIIETGIRNLRCFLPMDKCGNKTEEYGIGQLVFLKVEQLIQSSNASTITCAVIDNEKKRRVKDLTEPNLDYLLPSTLVNFTISKILKDGLQGTIMNESFNCYINEHQLSEPFALPEDYKVSKTQLAKILYVMPLTKLVYLSLNLNHETIETVFKRGDIIENAIVHHHGTGGIVLVLNNRHKGIISFSSIKINYTGNYDQDEVLSKYHKKSKHKIRIIEYDHMDSLYICSDNPKILNEKYFSLEDCEPGEFLNATVTEKDKITGSYYVQVGNCRGIIEKLHLSSLSMSIQDGQKIRCRVMAINTERNIVYLTNRSEYMGKNCTILTNIKQAQENKVFMGTIVKCNERFFIVKFFNNIKGILYKTRTIDGSTSSLEFSTYREGQTMPFKIIKRSDDKLLLDMVDNSYKIGEIYNGKIVHCQETGLDVSIERDKGDTSKGLVPVRMISEYPDLVTLKLNTFKRNEPVRLASIFNTIFSIRDVEYFENSNVKEFKLLESGDIVRGFIKNLDGDIVELLLPIRGYDKLLRVHLKMFLIDIINNPNILVVPDQIVYVKIMSKDIRTKTLTVSAKLTDVWNGDLKFSGNYFGKYLDELDLIRENLKEQNNPLGSIQIGEQLTGSVTVQIKSTGDWYVQLSNGLQGLIKSNFILKKDKNLEKGMPVNIVVLWIDYPTEIIYCSHKQNDIDKISMSGEIPTNLINKSNIKGKILLKLDNVIICSLKKGKNPIVMIPTKLHYNDFVGSFFNEVNVGDFERLTFVHDKRPIAVFEGTKKLWLAIQSRKRKLITDLEDRMDNKKFKGLGPTISLDKEPERVYSDCNSDSDLNSDSDQRVDIINKIEKTIKKRKSNTIEKINITEKQKKSSSVENLKSNVSVENTKMPGAGGFWSSNLTSIQSISNLNNDSSSEEENDTTKEVVKKKKLTSTEKFHADRVEEARLREIEEKYANPHEVPETADEFDRLVISDPNNSKNWISYMVFHLQAAEIDKSRAIARKALKSISFREQQEIINIWVALLNLELRYGTKDSYTDIFKESVLCNDPYKIHTRAIEILTEAKKTQELIDLIGTATKKFKDNPEIWKKSAIAYFSLDMQDKAKQLMHKALTVLPERDHVNTIVTFANLHHKYNDSETAHTLLEQIITSYPKRVDVWSQYVDMLIKDQQIDGARRTLERAVIQKIPIKKMRTLFKKYLDFEERHGNEENVHKVKELAANYVKNEINS